MDVFWKKSKRPLIPSRFLEFFIALFSEFLQKNINFPKARRPLAGQMSGGKWSSIGANSMIVYCILFGVLMRIEYENRHTVRTTNRKSVPAYAE